MESDFTNPEILLEYELREKEEQGCDVDKYRKKFDRVRETPRKKLLRFASDRENKNRKELKQLFQKITKLKEDNKYKEPDEFDKIIESSPDSPQDRNFSKTGIEDKIKGAWLGRCAGCLLGKPVEGWGKKDGKRKIKRYLKEAGEYPLRDYFPEPPSNKFEVKNDLKKALRPNVTHMIRDDDLNYSILNLKLLETYGKNFNGSDLVELWLKNLSYVKTYTAERIAYKNFLNGVMPSKSSRHLNPYREWIGARIRGDIFGWVNPMNPEKAAEMAYRDGIISHRKNGIYSEMFIAALISHIIGSENPVVEKAIETSLSVVPEKSRLFEAIQRVLKWSKEDKNWERTFEKVMGRFGDYHWIHSINNTALVVLALVHGKGDFEKSICISVMCAHDTDCNGAAAGSIIGGLNGAEKLPDKWIEPLNNKIESAIVGEKENKISDLSQRTVKLID